jgi:hypothetical protein
MDITIPPTSALNSASQTGPASFPTFLDVCKRFGKVYNLLVW